MDFQLMMDTYGFRVVWGLEMLLTVALAAVFYMRYKGGTVSGRQTASFFVGLFLLYFALGGPLNLGGHFWFSIHMLQQSVMYLIVPPLLLRGMPEGFFRALSDNPWSRRVIRVFGNPIFAMFLFNGAFSFYHIPVIFDAAMSNYALHNALHLLLFFSAFALWWSVFSPAGAIYAMSELKKMGYIFLNGILLTPACALIIFAKAPMYETYTAGGQLLCLPFYAIPVEPVAFSSPWLTPLSDQQLGGVIMKIMQEISYGCLLGLVFFQWYRREKDKAEDLPDPLLEPAP
ncbi:cytochrome c oxidase assembly protein [Paenibacillus ehimensis]|uniref:Cytochrome c oxidase assembly protein n=1 Tax=Paenibacillus ehimensis TaxID=79264 RepID=A0ABT8VIU6_9BACL|nr:cytochrome c oxidase assembly protein [Paenibacillus ehimensis]MDO3680905.1 cytochrome c oxidase assembly protein [Paenibacillus ehimensis]